jgi:hypothetical protein
VSRSRVAETMLSSHVELACHLGRRPTEQGRCVAEVNNQKSWAPLP